MVGIYKLNIARLRYLTVNGRQLAHILVLLNDAGKLQPVERAESLATSQNLLIVRALNYVIARAHIGNAVAVVRNVGTHRPRYATFVYQRAVYGKFNALVHHVSYVLKLSLHAARKAHRHIEQKVARLLVINIEHNVDAVLQQTKVKAEIVTCRCLPLQVIVRCVALCVARRACIRAC